MLSQLVAAAAPRSLGCASTAAAPASLKRLNFHSLSVQDELHTDGFVIGLGLIGCCIANFSLMCANAEEAEAAPGWPLLGASRSALEISETSGNHHLHLLTAGRGRAVTARLLPHPAPSPCLLLYEQVPCRPLLGA